MKTIYSITNRKGTVTVDYYNGIYHVCSRKNNSNYWDTCDYIEKAKAIERAKQIAGELNA